MLKRILKTVFINAKSFKNITFVKRNKFNFLPIFNRFNFTSTGNPETVAILEETESVIFQVLKEANKCKKENLKKTATFEDLGFDSLDSVELVVAIEERLGVDLTNEEAEKIRTVEDAVTLFSKYVLEKLNKGKLVEKDDETKVKK